MIKILIANRKGGVGKTTTTLNIANIFANRKYKTLIVDLDTQSHVQYGLGIKDNFEYGIHSALVNQEINVKDLICKSNIENLDFIPANINYNSSLIQKKKALKKLLKKVKHDYDICIIDTAPMSDSILEMAIIASKYVIVPMEIGPLGLIGTMQFIKIFYKNSSKLNKKLTLLGILPTLYNKSMREHNEIIKELQKVVGVNKVLPPIRKDAKLATIYQNGIYSISDKHSRGTDDYNEIVNIMIKEMFLK